MIPDIVILRISTEYECVTVVEFEPASFQSSRGGVQRSSEVLEVLVNIASERLESQDKVRKIEKYTEIYARCSRLNNSNL